MASDLTLLTQKVQAVTDATHAIITLVNGLAAQITSLKNDPAALQVLADQLTADVNDITAAVTANTPAAP